MIHVVSTEVGAGKGGISTALIGLRDAPQLKGKLSFITSHSQVGGRFSGLNAIWKVLTQVKSNDVVWLHCGPWFSILRKTAIALFAKCKGAKVVFHFHSPKMDEYLISRWAKFWLGCLLSVCDGVIVLTPWWRARFLNVFPKLKSKLFISPNPIDNNLLDLAHTHIENQSNLGTQYELLCMARLIPEKGVSLAIKALACLPDHYRLTIAGEGPDYEELLQLTEHYQLEKRVTFLGWVDYEQKHKLFESHSVFLLPSKYDSFGMSFVEAMAFGLPVVALKRQAIPDVVPDGKAGILCAEDNPQKIAQAIEYCMEHRDELGAFGVTHVQQHFNSQTIAINLLNIFQSKVS